MDMLETYLDAVAAQLPRDAADDIVAELRDTLLSRFEEREEVLGRPLTDEEREEVLRAMGHPLVVAARYRKGPQMLIGPELFPYWLFAVKAGLLIVAAVFALTLMLRLAGNPLDAAEAIAQSIHGLFGAGLTVIGAVTLAGAIFEHYGLRPPYLDTWRVKDLELLKFGDPARWTAQLGVDLHGRTRTQGLGSEGASSTRRGRPWRAWPGTEALFSIIVGLVFAAWWIGMLHIPGLDQFQLDGRAVTIVAGPVWTKLYLPILVYTLVNILVDAIGLVRPARTALRAALQIPVAIVGIALTWAILKANIWLTLIQGSGRAAVGADFTLQILNQTLNLGESTRSLVAMAATVSVITTWVLVIAMISLVFKILKSLWQLFGPRRAA